jgi:hypothetical protein
MASIAARVSLRSTTVAVRQLAFAWAIGSVLMGTVAVLFLAFPARAYVFPPGGSLRFSLPLPPDAVRGDLVVPLVGLPLLARLAVLLLGAALFVALGLLARWSGAASWLPANARGQVLWGLLTGGIGLVGWVFAASVTFALNFGPVWQGMLAFVAGGLPFALAAALLQPSWLVNLGAAGICAVLLVAGFVVVAARPDGGPNAAILALDYVRYLVGPYLPGLSPGQIPGGPIVPF